MDEYREHVGHELSEIVRRLDADRLTSTAGRALVHRSACSSSPAFVTIIWHVPMAMSMPLLLSASAWYTSGRPGVGMVRLADSPNI